MHLFVAIVFACYFWYRLAIVRKAVNSIKVVSVQYCLVEPMTLLTALFPMSRFNPGSYWMWSTKGSEYRKHSFDAVLFVPLFQGSPYLFVGSHEVIKRIFADPTAFGKPPQCLSLDMFGPNVVSSEGDQWRKHRKFMSPAFSQDALEDVWNVTSRLYQEMQSSQQFRGTDLVSFTAFEKITSQLALFVIGSCGFNMPLNWSDKPSKTDSSNELSLDEMIFTVTRNLLIRIFAPWMLYVPIPHLRRVRRAFRLFHQYLRVTASEKITELNREKEFGGGVVETSGRNAFERLALASQDETVDFTVEELTGNCFLMLLGGQETTATTMLLTLAYLGAYPEFQEQLHRKLVDILGDREMTFHDYSSLSPVLECFCEALRLYPSAYVMLRQARADTTLQFPDASGAALVHNVCVPKGTVILIDEIALNRHPGVYPDPGAFVPSRWRGKTTEDFLAFGSGPRVCMGKKFAQIEAVCFLTRLLRDWRIEVPMDGFGSRQEWEEKALYPKMDMFLRVENVALKLHRRAC